MEQALNAQVQDLKRQVEHLTFLMEKNNFSDNQVFDKKVTFKRAVTFGDIFMIADGLNFILGTTTGTKFGTSASQKIGFFNKTPVVQQSAITTPAGGGSGSTDAIDISARTAIGQIKTALTNLGLTA